MFRFVIYFFLVSYTTNAKVDPDCLNWFQKSKLKSTEKGCILSCAALPIDFNTFHCPNQCEELCKKANQCNVDLFWKGKLKSGRPQDWSISNEKTAEWTKAEEDQIIKVLSRLPDELKNVPINGFYRMQKSVVLTNPATTSSTGKSIAIYDRTFDNPFWSVEDVILHELGHFSYLHLSEAEKLSFKDQMGWKQSLVGDSSRKGDFVSPRAKDSPEEEFAENFSFFLKDPGFLKEKSTKAYEWLIKKYSDNFKYKKDCEHEKK